jgi:signal transduction histidine kinase
MSESSVGRTRRTANNRHARDLRGRTRAEAALRTSKRAARLLERSHASNVVPRGLGVIGMRERVLLVGGTLELESQPGHGATTFVRIPSQRARTNGTPS